MNNKLSLILALTSGMMWPLSAYAKPDAYSDWPEDEGAGLSIEQQMLTQKALEALKNGKYKEAEMLLTALNRIEEYNVTWFNLGTVYAQQNKCIEAYDAFNRVFTAPMPDTKQFYIEDIEEGTHKAIADLDIQCSASLVFKCTPKNAMLSIDGQADFECNSNPVPVVPGRHTVYAKTASGFLPFEPVAVTGQVTEVNVTIEDYNPIPIPKYTLEGLTNTSRNYKIAGYTLLGAGILGAGISGGLTGYYYSDDRDAHKTDLIYSYTFLGISSAMAVTGAILLIVDALTYQPIIDDLKNREIDSDIIAISPMISSSFSGISLLGRF